MASILILYPSEFKCFSKFKRKVLRILRNLESFTVLYPSDENSFIVELFSNNAKVKLVKEENWKRAGITHAIVFDDGEVFVSEIEHLKKNNIEIREVKIAITRVINIKKETAYLDKKSTPDYEYIGRGSYWGNPYSMYEEGETREEVIRKYEYDFRFDKFPNKDKSKVYELAGKRLGCFCKPEACHGDVLADFLNSWDDGK